MDNGQAPPDLTLDHLTDRVRAQNSETASTSSVEAPANLEAAAAAVQLEAAPAALPPPVMARPEWCDLYLKCHGIAGHMVGSRVLQGVPERAGGGEAAGAVYDTILDTPALHFLIAPGGIWFQRATLVVLFYAPIVGELRAERIAAAAPRKVAPPAPSAPALDTGGFAMPPPGAV